jgi:hypothetical protein
MHFRTKLSSLLRTYPYSRPFNSYSASHKSTVATTLHDVAIHLSGQQPEQLYKYLFRHSHTSKNTFPDIQNATKTSKMLINLKTLHANAPVKHKSNILSLVVDLFSRKELKQAGFTFIHTQYTTAKQKASQETFSLDDYQRYVPISKRKKIILLKL